MELGNLIDKNTKILKSFYEIQQILALCYKNAIFSKSPQYGFNLPNQSQEAEIWSSNTSISLLWYVKIYGTDN